MTNGREIKQIRWLAAVSEFLSYRRLIAPLRHLLKQDVIGVFVDRLERVKRPDRLGRGGVDRQPVLGGVHG